jgi:hypothetical protein
VSATGDELYVDLPDDVAQRLADPPVTEKKLLELGVAWTGLSAVQAQLVELLRVFVITGTRWNGWRRGPRGSPPSISTLMGPRS